MYIIIGFLAPFVLVGLMAFHTFVWPKIVKHLTPLTIVQQASLDREREIDKRTVDIMRDTGHGAAEARTRAVTQYMAEMLAASGAKS